MLQILKTVKKKEKNIVGVKTKIFAIKVFIVISKANSWQISSLASLAKKKNQGAKWYSTCYF